MRTTVSTRRRIQVNKILTKLSPGDKAPLVGASTPGKGEPHRSRIGTTDNLVVSVLQAQGTSVRRGPDDLHRIRRERRLRSKDLLTLVEPHRRPDASRQCRTDRAKGVNAKGTRPTPSTVRDAPLREDWVATLAMRDLRKAGRVAKVSLGRGAR